MRLLKRFLLIILITVGIVGGIYAVYRFILPDTFTHSIEETIAGMKDELGIYQDSGISGKEYEFDEVYYPYYSFLSDEAKLLYKQVYANAWNMETSFIPTVEVTVEEVSNVVNAVYHDHPELFWMESGYTYKFTEDDICVHIMLNFNETADDIENTKKAFEARANEILNGAAALDSDYEKEKYVYKMLIDKVEYDEEAELHQSPYSAMVYGKTVCAGYARAFQYLMLELGVPTFYCTGQSKGHAWNIVRLESGYYNVDVSMADVKQSPEKYFNRTDEDLENTHQRSGYSTILPQCRTKKYSGMDK